MHHQPIGRCETEFTVTDLIGDRPQVGLLRVLQDNQVVASPLLIPEKQVLTVRGVDRRPMLFGFLDGRNRWMLMPRKRNPELSQPGRHCLFLCGEMLRGHRGISTAAPTTRPARRSPSAWFASERSYRRILVRTGTVGASARNSRASCRVRFATERTTRSCQSKRYGNDGMSLM